VKVSVSIGDLVLERYRVVEQIASGGHSVVFRGTDERLSRPVCVKVFSGLGGDSGVGRTSYEHFVQEAFALSRLTHPNTLRIYDFGHLGPTPGTSETAGMPVQVCEFMNDGTLSNIVRERGPQSLAETSRVIGAMCAALGEAHALGIVHRDIKPQNILFGSVGGARLPKLADFGIAKWMDESEENENRAEDTAIVAGQKLAMYSPSWAAPEQLAGQPVSAATDIYSLAVVAVYMLSGRAIFADEDVYLGYKKRRTAPDLVRETLAPFNVPKSVVAMLGTAIAFDPTRRLAGIEQLASGLAAAAEPPMQLASESTQEVFPNLPTNPGSLRAMPASSESINKDSRPRPALAGVSQSSESSGEGSTPAAPDPAPAPATPAPAPPHVVSSWPPAQVRTPWMAGEPPPTGAPPTRLALVDLAQTVGSRKVQVLHAASEVIDLTGGPARIRVTFMSGAGGKRIVHVKGLSCFVAPLGGRPSPAVPLDKPGDLALVTPRAQEIGHIRVATGIVAEPGWLVFHLGADSIAVSTDDCTDPILFDFGPGAEAFVLYTHGRPIPKTPPTKRR
jgi:eukaryotic-like serine/threonine-protein kinase